MFIYALYKLAGISASGLMNLNKMFFCIMFVTERPQSDLLLHRQLEYYTNLLFRICVSLKMIYKLEVMARATNIWQPA